MVGGRLGAFAWRWAREAGAQPWSERQNTTRHGQLPWLDLAPACSCHGALCFALLHPEQHHALSMRSMAWARASSWHHAGGRGQARCHQLRAATFWPSTWDRLAHPPSPARKGGGWGSIPLGWRGALALAELANLAAPVGGGGVNWWRMVRKLVRNRSSVPCGSLLSCAAALALTASNMADSAWRSLAGSPPRGMASWAEAAPSGRVGQERSLRACWMALVAGSWLGWKTGPMAWGWYWRRRARASPKAAESAPRSSAARRATARPWRPPKAAPRQQAAGRWAPGRLGAAQTGGGQVGARPERDNAAQEHGLAAAAERYVGHGQLEARVDQAGIAEREAVRRRHRIVQLGIPEGLPSLSRAPAGGTTRHKPRQDPTRGPAAPVLQPLRGSQRLLAPRDPVKVVGKGLRLVDRAQRQRDPEVVWQPQRIEQRCALGPGCRSHHTPPGPLARHAGPERRRSGSLLVCTPHASTSSGRPVKLLVQ